MTLVVQTETIVFFLLNKIKCSSAVLIFDSRSMVALYIGYLDQAFAMASLNCANENIYL